MKNIFAMKSFDTKKKLNEPVSNKFLVDSTSILFTCFNESGKISAYIILILLSQNSMMMMSSFSNWKHYSYLTINGIFKSLNFFKISIYENRIECTSPQAALISFYSKPWSIIFLATNIRPSCERTRYACPELKTIIP